MKGKTLSVFLLTVLVVLPPCCFSESPDPKIWKPLKNHLHYNKTIITKSPDILLVWTYQPVTQEARSRKAEQIKTSAPEKSSKYNLLHHETYLWKIDCLNKRISLSEFIDFDQNGQVLDRYEYEHPEWSPIHPQTGADLLYQKVCHPPQEPPKKTRRGKSSSKLSP